MKSAKSFFSALLLMLICTGCILTPRDDVRIAHYDLAIPAKVKSYDQINVAQVDNSSPAQSRMLYRMKGNRMVNDNANYWIQPPDRMLQRYFEQAFQVAGNHHSKNKIDLRCSINTFEFDIVNSEAVLSLKYTMRSNMQRCTGNLLIREKFTSREPIALAAAMDRAAAGAVIQLELAAQKFFNKKQ